MFPNLTLTTLSRTRGKFLICVLQTRKVRLREAKRPAPGHGGGVRREPRRVRAQSPPSRTATRFSPSALHKVREALRKARLKTSLTNALDQVPTLP